jgi:hypothetical protein
MAKLPKTTTTYLSRTYDPLRHWLIDMAIGLGVGFALAIVAWLCTLLCWAAYGT